MRNITPPDRTPAVTILKNKNRAEKIINTPTLRQLKPLHQRIQEYQEARKRIFGTTSARIKKTRLRYKRRKQLRREIASTTLFEGSDSRFYAEINIKGIEVLGLVDSGATVTCLGKGCEDLVEKAGLEVHHFGSRIRTADGSAHRILGRVRTKINFGKKSAEINFYLVPTL